MESDTSADLGDSVEVDRKAAAIITAAIRTDWKEPEPTPHWNGPPVARQVPQPGALQVALNAVEGLRFELVDRLAVVEGICHGGVSRTGEPQVDLDELLRAVDERVAIALDRCDALEERVALLDLGLEDRVHALETERKRWMPDAVDVLADRVNALGARLDDLELLADAKAKPPDTSAELAAYRERQAICRWLLDETGCNPSITAEIGAGHHHLTRPTPE